MRQGYVNNHWIPFVRTDPDNRCAAMLVFGSQVSNFHNVVVYSYCFRISQQKILALKTHKTCLKMLLAELETTFLKSIVDSSRSSFYRLKGTLVKVYLSTRACQSGRVPHLRNRARTGLPSLPRTNSTLKPSFRCHFESSVKLIWHSKVINQIWKCFICSQGLFS